MLAKFSLLFALLSINLASAAMLRVPRTLVNRQGTQFITGPCQSDADCALGCCGFNTGKCAGPVVAQERDGGCGFGDPVPNDNAARVFRGQAPAPAPQAPAPQAPAPAPQAPPPINNNGASPVRGTSSGKPLGTQFITGNCASDAECASGCCGFNTGKCAGAIVALERDGGCGNGNAVPNDNAARVLRGQAPAPAPAPQAPAPQAPAPQTPPPVNNGGAATPVRGTPSGKPPGTQFITGNCASDAECASGCCGFNTGKCAGAIVALERDGGCGNGNAVPNDNAARRLRGQAR